MQVRISKDLLNNIVFYERQNYESNDVFILNIENGIVVSAEMVYDNGLGPILKTVKEED